MKNTFPHSTPSARRGFTLIEVLIYTVFVTLLGVAAMGGLLAMFRGFSEIRVGKDIHASAIATLERITREIRSGNSVDLGQSTLDAHPGRLTLNTVDMGGSPTTVEFFISNGLVRVKEGGVDKGQLMSSHATTTNFIFQLINTGTSAGVRVQMTLEATRGSTQTQSTFYTTALLRESY